MYDIWHSAEARWFFRGKLPRDFLNWFLSGRDIDPQERVDTYLLFPGCESVGVKQREGRFEIKAIRGASETVRLAPQVTARMDAWAKWSYEGTGVEALIAGLQDNPAGWLPVNKQRWLRKFSLDHQRPEEVAVKEFPDEGGNIELTAVRTRQSDWWTIGLEAFGAAGNVRRNLALVAAHFFAKNELPRPLDTTRSCSYPVWLNSIV